MRKSILLILGVFILVGIQSGENLTRQLTSEIHSNFEKH